MVLAFCIAAAAQIFLGGCAHKFTASASCAYKAGYASGSRYITSYDPEAKCQFSLTAPLRGAKNAVEFSDAFSRMMLSTPLPEGTTWQVQK
jgi:hypothetical protein